MKNNIIKLNGHTTTTITISQYTKSVRDNYQNTQQEYQNKVVWITEKIGKRIVEETNKEIIMQNYIDQQLRELIDSPCTVELNYRAFGELFGYNDQQIYEVKQQCPTPQAFLEYYAAQDAKQLAEIITKLEIIKKHYEDIVGYCSNILINSHNRNTYEAVVLVDQGLQSFTAAKIKHINNTGNEVMGLATQYQYRKWLERLGTDPITRVDVSALDRSSN